MPDVHEDNRLEIPHHLTPDYVLLGCYLALFAIGAPINLIAFSNLRLSTFDDGSTEIKSKKLHRNGVKARVSGSRMLKADLNLINLLIIFVYTPAKICWLITFSWRGGVVLCKMVKFSDSVIFQLSSNLIVCISLDRLILVAFKRHKAFMLKSVRFCYWCVWITAFLFHLPQLAVWTTVTPRPDLDPDWHQCVTIWHANAIHFSHFSNSTEQFKPFIDQNSFTLISLALISWIPLMLITLSYSVVVLGLYSVLRRHSNIKRDVNNKLETRETVLPDLSQNSVRETQRQDGGSESLEQISTSLPSPRRDDCRMAGDEKIVFVQGDEPNKSVSDWPVSSLTSGLMLSSETRHIWRSTVRTSALLVVAYLLCWMPYNAIGLWYLIDVKSYTIGEPSLRFAYACIVLNAVINPFLYDSGGSCSSTCLTLKNYRNIRHLSNKS